MSVSTGVEKLNDVAKQSYFSSCKWNTTKEILLTEWRMTANSLLFKKNFRNPALYLHKKNSHNQSLGIGSDGQSDATGDGGHFL